MMAEYLSKNKVLTVYRVLENARGLESCTKKVYAEITSSYLKIPEDQALKIYLEASDIIFRNSRNYFTRHSRLCVYNENSLTRICDIACIGYDKGSVNSAFEKELERSRKIRQSLEKYLERHLNPFLSRLAKNPGIRVIARRGDLLIHGRSPTTLSNLNIVLVTSPGFDVSILKRSPGRVEYYDFSKKDFASSVILKERGRYRVYYDVMTLGWFEGYLKYLKGVKNKNNYDYLAFKHAKIIHDKIGLKIRI